MKVCHFKQCQRCPRVSTHPRRHLLSGYGTYLLNLVDAAIEDHQYDPHLFQFTQQALQRMDQGDDAEIITNILKSKYCNASELHQSGHTASYVGKQKENLTILPNMVV